MECIFKSPEKGPQLEKYFRIPIKMTLQDKMSWPTLASLINDMAVSQAECKKLIKILSKELA